VNEKPKLTAGEMALAAAKQLLASGKPFTRDQVADLAGVSHATADTALAKLPYLKEKEPELEPPVKGLTKARQAKFNALVRAKLRELELDFEIRVQTEIHKRLEETVLPELRSQKAEADQIIKSRKGILTKAEYGRVLKALHPDSALNLSPEERRDLLALWAKHKLALLSEKEQPTFSTDVRLPRTAAEMMAMRKKKFP
jgi:hypothetical protein